jgi:phage internal scaffolding protein
MKLNFYMTYSAKSEEKHMFTAQKKHHRRVQIDFKDDKGLTEQSHKKSCDMHHIMKNAERTGVIEHLNAYPAGYGDMPSSTDFHEHMNAVVAAQEMFESVPSEIRKKFGNDPAEFLEFMEDNKNYEAIEKMGLQPERFMKNPNPREPEPDEPQRVIIVNNETQPAE